MVKYEDTKENLALLKVVYGAGTKLELYPFLKECLGYIDMNSVHYDLCELLQSDGLFKLILMPRYSFKSTIVTVGYAIWRLMSDLNMRILIYSDASTKASGFLTSIKSHLEGKVKGSKFALANDWAGDVKSGKWNESQIVIKARTTQYPEPSVDTGGIETSKVGMHYDLIIFDDIVSDKNVTTKEQMDKVAECYSRALSLLRPGGEVIIVGTRWHFGDLYGRIIAESEEKKLFKLFIIDGEDDKKYGKYCFSNIGKNSLTKEFLGQQKLQQGTSIYSCLYRNNPTDAEDAAFKARDFAFYGDIKSEDLYITCTCDPAGEGEDFTALSVVGTDSDMNMNILELVNKHLQPSEIINEVFRLHYKYGFKMFGLETNFFRGMLRLELERRIREERDKNEKFRIFGVTEFEATSRRGQGKANRIMALQPYHERGALKFPGKKLELLNGDFAVLSLQMLQFPNSAHDDLLDSMAYHLNLIRRGGLVKKAELPKNSPADLERRAYDEVVRKNNMLPRRFRNRVEHNLTFS
jgi:predicted phage terminase large subunit-like protein